MPPRVGLSSVFGTAKLVIFSAVCLEFELYYRKTELVIVKRYA